MTKFAHTETGKALDPSTAASAAVYRAMFAPAVSGGWTVTQVPDDTQHGATPNGDGTWTNPADPPAQIKYRQLTPLEFVTLCQTAGGMTDSMLVACKADPLYAAFWIKFGIAQGVDKSNPITQGGLTGIAAGGYLPNGVAAVNAAWPQG